MAVTTDTEVRELRELILSLREEMRIGFAQMDTKFIELKAELKGEIQRVEAKTDIELAKLNGKIDVLDERTKVGFWGFIGRAVIIGLIGGAIAFGTKFFLTGRLTF
jgi:hypothetical protein